MRTTLLTLLIFAMSAFVGPLLRFLVQPTTRLEGLVYDLVFYLWPAQPLATYEASAGRPMALLYSVGGNLLVFLVLGCLISAVGGRRAATFVVYAVWCGLLFLYGMWGAGFSLAHLSWAPFLLSLLFYSVPFLLSSLLARGRSLPVE